MTTDIGQLADQSIWAYSLDRALSTKAVLK
jgi:hypothetical protein